MLACLPSILFGKPSPVPRLHGDRRDRAIIQGIGGEAVGGTFHCVLDPIPFFGPSAAFRPVIHPILQLFIIVLVGPGFDRLHLYLYCFKVTGPDHSFHRSP